jgi:hypothetical protein
MDRVGTRQSHGGLQILTMQEATSFDLLSSGVISGDWVLLSGQQRGYGTTCA